MLERLVGLLPIILLFVVPALIALRRATRRRRQARAEGLAAGDGQAVPSDRPAEGFPPRQAAGLVPGQIARTAGTEVPGAPAMGPARELYVYPPPLELKRLQAASGAAVAGAPAVLVGIPATGARTAGTFGRTAGTFGRTSGTGARAAGASAPGSASPAHRSDSRGEMLWRRLAVMPPLQRAIAFSEILGPPRGLTGPAGSLASEGEL